MDHIHIIKWQRLRLHNSYIHKTKIILEFAVFMLRKNITYVQKANCIKSVVFFCD